MQRQRLPARATRISSSVASFGSVEAAFEDAPHKAKGVGELPMDVGAPAVVAAIHDATGAWNDDLPATPERILAALAGLERPGAPGVSAVSKAPGA